MERHELTNDVLLDFAMNRLSSAEAAAVQQHVEADPELRRRAEELRRLGKLLRENYKPMPVARPDARDAAMSGMIAEFVEAARSGMPITVQVQESDVVAALATVSAEAETVRAPLVTMPPAQLQPPSSVASASSPVSVPANEVVGGRRWNQTWRYAAAAAVILGMATWSFLDDGKSTWSNTNRPSEWPTPSSVGGRPLPNLTSANTNATSNAPRDEIRTNPGSNATANLNPRPASNQPGHVIDSNRPESTPAANSNSNSNSIDGPAAVTNKPATNANPATNTNAGAPHTPNQQTPPVTTQTNNNGRPQGQDVTPMMSPNDAMLMDRIRQAVNSAGFMAMTGAPKTEGTRFVVRATPQRGDVDGNGVVDQRDASLLLKQLLKSDGKPAPASAINDYNGDGKVDIRDYMRLLNDTRTPD